MGRKYQAGNLMVGAVIGVGLAAAAAAGLGSLIAVQMRSVKHLELRQELLQIRDQVHSRLDCAATLAALACPVSSWAPGQPLQGPFVTLRDAGGLPLGTPVGNHNRVGSWTLRAVCINNPALPLRTLKIQRSRPLGDASLAASFASNPLTKRTEDWQDLMADGVSLCAREIAGVALGPSPGPAAPGNPVLSVPLTVVSPGPTGRCGDFFTTLLSPLFGAKRIIGATVRCPTGQKVRGGGVECGVASRFLFGSAKGLVLSSRPTADGAGWQATCCSDGGRTTGTEAFAICE
jgi:hypothetical protein